MINPPGSDFYDPVDFVQENWSLVFSLITDMYEKTKDKFGGDKDDAQAKISFMVACCIFEHNFEASLPVEYSQENFDDIVKLGLIINIEIITRDLMSKGLISSKIFKEIHEHSKEID